jgi:hypothetical protein
MDVGAQPSHGHDAYTACSLSLLCLSWRFSRVRCRVASLRFASLADIRSLGWRRGLSISFPKANYTVRVWSSNALSNMWENSCCWCLCHVTIIPCIVMRCYRDCGGHKETGVRSVFRIDYHPVQVFEMIRPRLWCKGWSGMQMAMELYRDMFW